MDVEIIHAKSQSELTMLSDLLDQEFDPPLRGRTHIGLSHIAVSSNRRPRGDFTKETNETPGWVAINKLRPLQTRHEKELTWECESLASYMYLHVSRRTD